MFIDEFFADDFYQKLPLDYAKNLRFGQICFTHAYYPHEGFQVFRPVSVPGEPTKSIADKFKIIGRPPDAFARSFPLAAPKLATNEEFIVIRAKVRPVVVLHIPSTILGTISNAGFSGKTARNLCVVGQIFGLADVKTRKPVFNNSIIERVRRMEFPELMFMPQHGGLFEVDSLLRLDELQSVFVPHLKATQYSLSLQLTEILQGQLQTLLSRPEDNLYTELREELLKS